MSVNGITTNTGLTAGKTSYTDRNKKSDSKRSVSEKASSEAAIYEKSDETLVTAKQNNKVDYETIAKLKADAEKSTAHLKSLVEKMMTKQGQTLGKAGVLDFENGSNLADIFRNLEVDEETRAKAQADIADDGYWGVEQTSERMLDFAKALAGNDPDKAREMLDAIKQGFQEAEKMWGEELPELSRKTMDTTLDKVNKWIEELGG